MKLPIILAAVVSLALLGGGYFFVMPMMKSQPAAEAHDEELEEEEEEAPAAAKKKKKKAHAEPGLIYPVSERVLNLVSSGGVPRYARIEMAIEFEKPDGYKPPKAGGGHGAPAAEPHLDPALEPVEHRKAQIDDTILRIVGSMTVEELTTNEGKDRLKQEILTAIEEMVSSPTVTSVYIVRLIVQ
jgi:flagellar FliL protein